MSMTLARSRLKELREGRRLTLEQVAKRAGTTFQTISKLERGEQRLTHEWAEALARALNVTVDAVLGNVAPDDRVCAQNEQEAQLLTQWRLMPLDDQLYLAETIHRISLNRLPRIRVRTG